MSESHTIILTARRPGQSRTIKSNEWPAYLKSCLKTAYSFAHGNYFAAITSALDAIGARPKFEKQLSGDEQCWTIIQRACVKGLTQTIRIHRYSLREQIGTNIEFSDNMVCCFDKDTFQVSRSFLQNPSGETFVKEIRNSLHAELETLGADTNLRATFTKTFNEEVVLSVDSELRNFPNEYELLESTFRFTFTDENAEKVRRWKRYRNALIDAVRYPVLEFGSGHTSFVRKSEEGANGGISVPLNELFVWPRGYFYAEKIEWSEAERASAEFMGQLQRFFDEPEVDQSSEKRSVWLREHIFQWLTDPQYDIQVVTGEAGLGKTSFVRMVAAELAEAEEYVIYVPMDVLNFSAQRSAWGALSDYISSDRPDRLGFAPSKQDFDAGNRLIMIIDGLDELSRSGETAEDVAAGFLESLKDFLREVNDMKETRVLVLLAGRPKVTANYAGKFSAEGQLSYIARLGPVRVKNTKDQSDEEKSDEQKEESEENDSGHIDLRGQWWRNFRLAIDEAEPTVTANGDLDWVPEIFKDPEFQFDQTAPPMVPFNDPILPKYRDFLDQPLLTYFLAVLLYTNESAFRQVKNRADLFDQMFRLFFSRQKVKQQTSGDGLQYIFAKEDRYSYLLELIAVAAWQHGDRSVDMATVDKRFENDVHARKILRATFETEEPDSSDVAPIISGVVNSFFVGKEQDQPAGVFEFTHKAFREYLSARRLVKVVQEISVGMSDNTYTKKEAAEKFYREFWECRLSVEMSLFLRETLQRLDISVLTESIMPCFQKLFRYVIDQGCPGSLVRSDINPA